MCGSECLKSRVLSVMFLFLLSTSYSFCAPASGAQGKELFSPRHVAKIRSVSSAAVSPDGRSIAYVLSVPRKILKEEDGPAWSELHIVDRSGRSRPLLAGHNNVRSVTFRPRSNEITYLNRTGQDKGDSLFSIPVRGGKPRRLLSFETGIRAYTFSPEGDKVCFLAPDPPSEKEKLYRKKGFNQIVFEEENAPVRARIAELRTGKIRKLSVPGSVSLVRFSPDGRFLLAVKAPTPLVDDSYMRRRIVIVDVDTGKIVQRIHNPGKLGKVKWSPDGCHIAFISAADVHDPRAGRLVAASVPGEGSFRDLMPRYEAHVRDFAWLDTKTLLWVAAEGTSVRVGTVDLEGRVKTLLKPGGPILSGLSLSSDKLHAALVGHTPRHPSEVFLFSLRDKKLKRLTNSNPWLSRMRFARQEVIRWKARDGLELEGILLYPLNWVRGRRYPLILCVHGGPEAHVSNGWVTSYSRLGQVAAARGFAVFYPNYRGSTGRGVAFSKLGQADAAGKEFRDLIDAVDHLVSIGIADRRRVGITGGSYGGYATAWGATYYSKHFAAGVMFVGISDCISKMGTTDIPDEMYYVHHLKRLWEDWDYFLKRSPIRYVERCRTPLLILHGTEDPRVHPSQSLELYRHLKTLAKAPVRLIFYPGEGHGNRRAASRFDYNLRALRWFEHYLFGPGGPPPPYRLDYKAALEK